MRATVLHSAHIGKTASRITYGEFGSGIAFEEKQSCILFIRIFRFFFFCINIVENSFTSVGSPPQGIDNLYGFIWVDVVVPSELQFTQCIAAHIPIIHWKKQASVSSKNGIINHFLNGGGYSKWLCHLILRRKAG